MNVLIRTLWVCSDDCDQATSGTVPAQGLELVDIYLINNISCSASSEKPLVLLPRFIVRPSEDCFSSLPLIFLKLHWKISIIYRVKYIHIHREKYTEPSCTPSPTSSCYLLMANLVFHLYSSAASSPPPGYFEVKFQMNFYICRYFNLHL